MGRVVVYDPSDPQVAGKVTQFLPSAHVPNYQGNPNTLINPDLSALWDIPTQSYLVPLKYWKYDGVGDIVEMSSGEKATIDTIPPEYEVLNQQQAGGSATLDGGLQIERGASANASLRWSETLDTWIIGLFDQEVEVADIDQLTALLPASSIEDLGDVRSPMSPADGEVLTWNAGNSEWENQQFQPMRPTFAIWAEENSNVSVSANNYEYSFGNGAVNSGFSDVPGIPMGVECTLIGIGVSSRGNSTGTNSISISVTKNGVVVGTSAIFASVGQNVKVNGHTDITPDTVNFSKGDTLQFLTASASGTHDDVRVVAWFERTS